MILAGGTAPEAKMEHVLHTISKLSTLSEKLCNIQMHIVWETQKMALKISVGCAFCKLSTKMCIILFWSISQEPQGKF